jgi:hypothetical protein
VITEEEREYVEHDRVLESFAIDGHPLIPGDGLIPFEDLFGVSIQPALRLWPGEVPEGRSRVANPVFDEGVGKDYEGSGEKREGKEPSHVARCSGEAEGVYIVELALRTVSKRAS